MTNYFTINSSVEWLAIYYPRILILMIIRKRAVDFSRAIDSKLALKVGKDDSEARTIYSAMSPIERLLISVKAKNFGKPQISHSCEFYLN
jgi:hypothetical protein